MILAEIITNTAHMSSIMFHEKPKKLGNGTFLGEYQTRREKKQNNEK
jgi:hypothetical protein